MNRNISVIFIIICSVSVIHGKGCRRDVTFIMDSNINLCSTAVRCNYCWGEFFSGFLGSRLDLSELDVDMHVYHGHGLVYGCHLNPGQLDTCGCTGNTWSHNAATIPTLLQIAKDNFATGRRSDVEDVIVLILSNSFSGGVDDIAKSLRQRNVHVVAVGVGTNVDSTQLSTLASDDNSLLLLHTRTMLLNSASHIRSLVCRSCQRDVTFVMALKESSPGRKLWSWCAGGLISKFVSSLDSQVQITSVDWKSDGSATGCQMDWTSNSTNCTCPKSKWSTLSPSLIYENIINRFSNLRPEYPNVIVLVTDRQVGISGNDLKVYQDNGVLVVTVGIGAELNSTELNNFATFSNTSFIVDNWVDVSMIIPKLRHIVCYDTSLQTGDIECPEGRVEVTFLVDHSQSMTPNVPSVKNFLKLFVNTLNIEHDKQHVTIITFASEANIATLKAENMSDVVKAIDEIKPQFGPSNIATALRKVSELTRASTCLLSDNGETCPRLSVLILSDGLSGNRANALKEARTLQQLGAKLSYVSFRHGGTVYEQEGIVSNQFTAYEHGSVWNMTVLTELQTEILQGRHFKALSSWEVDCVYAPAVVVFVFSVSQREVMDTYLAEFDNFTKTSSITPEIHAIYPRDIGFPYPPLKVAYTVSGLSLLDMLQDVQNLNITKDSNTCYIIVTDKTDSQTIPVFKKIWHLSNAGSKIMSVGVGVDVSHYMVERIASVPRYAFSAPDVWSHEVPKGLWRRHCEACGFSTPIDVVFYVEASSATFTKWPYITQFLLIASDSFPVGNKNVLVSVVTFGQRILSRIDFNSYTNKMELFSYIRELKARQGSADITAVQQDIKTIFSGGRGGRTEAKQVIVLILDITLDAYLNASYEVQTILLDISHQNVSSLQSKYLKASDYYIKASGINDIITYQGELHKIICRDMSK